MKTKGFCEMMRGEAESMRAAGRFRTAEMYAGRAADFERFLGKDTSPEALTAGVGQAYERSLYARGLCRNTVSSYIRPLKAFYNRLVRRKRTKDRGPFAGCWTGVDETARRALTLAQIRALRDAPLESGRQRLARDLFMFSFYAQGMSFADIACLRKDAVRDGVITYRRRKTGRIIRVPVTKPMREIMDRYRTADKYPEVFPLAYGAGDVFYRTYKASQMRVLSYLREAGRAVPEIGGGLTFHAARHSWATAALKARVPASVISECLGHRTEEVTRVYLAGLDMSDITDAGLRVAAALDGKEEP